MTIRKATITSLGQNDSLSVLVVQEAAPKMWNVMTASLTAEPTVTTWDHPHAMSHLWAAAEADADTQELMDVLAALRDNDDTIEAIHQRIVWDRMSEHDPSRHGMMACITRIA